MSIKELQIYKEIYKTLRASCEMNSGEKILIKFTWKPANKVGINEKAHDRFINFSILLNLFLINLF